MRLAHKFRRAAGELFGDEAVLIVVGVAIAEEPPGERDHVRLTHRGVKRAKRAVADLDVDEFIHVHADRPTAVLHDPFALGRLKGRVLGLDVGQAAERVVAVLDDPAGLKRVQQRVGAVGAIVGIDEEIVHPDGAVIGDPFKDEGAFVLHRGDDAGPPGMGRPRRGLARGGDRRAHRDMVEQRRQRDQVRVLDQ